MRSGLSRLLSVIGAVLLASVPAEAHVRWFVTPAQAAEMHTQLPVHVVGGLVLIAIGLVAVGKAADMRFCSHLPQPTLQPWMAGCIRYAAVFMLIGAASQGWFFTPDSPLEHDTFDMLLAFGETVVAIALCADTAWAGYALVALVALGTLHEPMALVDHLDMVGCGLFIALWRTRPQAWAVLRIALGASIALLGLSEKLLDPALSAAFLQMHPWNFMAAFGMTNVQFICCAGTAELVVGGLLIVGALPELVCLAVLGLMTLTASLMGSHEWIGHLPYIAFCVTLALGRVTVPKPSPLYSPSGRLAHAHHTV